MTKIDSRRLDLDLQKVDVAGLISKAFQFNARLARQKDITLDCEVPPDIGTARLDPSRIRQVMDNLITNAVKYSNPGTNVAIGAKMESGRLAIWVQDHGVGKGSRFTISPPLVPPDSVPPRPA